MSTRCYHNNQKVEGLCSDCWHKQSSLCPRCSAVVTNAAYFKKTSPHFKGTCKPSRIWDATYEFELKHRRPQHPDWRYAAPWSTTAQTMYASR